VFENKFPSFVPDAPAPEEPGSELTPTAPGRGVCEVVLYADDHHATLAQMPERRFRQLVEVWADRCFDLGSLEYVKYVFIFENKGEVIGVTLHHPHGQICAYPFIPPRPARELQAAREYRAAHEGCCLHCAILAQEHADGRRCIIRGDHFTAFVPFFAHYPYEVHIYANRCVPSLTALNGAERRDLAHVLKRLLMGYDALWGFSLPYMMVMHQAPTEGGDYQGIAHFHIEFYPSNRTRDKLKYLAGSETGAGTFIMDALPEATALELRAAGERASGQ